MLQKFQQHISQNFPFFVGKKIVIAISGGLDSVVLTHLCLKSNLHIALAHCNFQLRKNDSDLDEELVTKLGKTFNLETFLIKFNTQKYAKEHKLSIQLSARKLRYNWFQELIKKHQFDYVLTAHHADDNLETFLINLTRGTGLEGLTGIPQQNRNIVRPLLVFSRNEIKNYAQNNNIEWREDTSNAETKYLRNKIRHEIVPKLKEINPSLLESFGKTLSFLKENQQIVADRIADVSDKIITQNDNILQFDIKKLKKLSNPKAYLYQLLQPYGFTEWNDVYNLLSAQSGKQVFSKTHRLLKNREFLLLSDVENDTKRNAVFELPINLSSVDEPVSLIFETVSETVSERKNNKTIHVDKDLLKYPLSVRKWQKGDYFCPLGMRGSKKVSKYFKDEKFSLLKKEQTWLLCSATNEIIWVIGHRQDKRFIPQKQTKQLLKITTN